MRVVQQVLGSWPKPTHVPGVIRSLCWNESTNAQMIGTTPNRPMSSTAGDTKSQPASVSPANRRSRREARRAGRGGHCVAARPRPPPAALHRSRRASLPRREDAVRPAAPPRPGRLLRLGSCPAARPARPAERLRDLRVGGDVGPRLGDVVQVVHEHARGGVLLEVRLVGRAAWSPTCGSAGRRSRWRSSRCTLAEVNHWMKSQAPWRSAARRCRASRTCRGRRWWRATRRPGRICTPNVDVRC